ncbi:1,4-alpha-glucan branching protein GlgB [Romboutsia sp. 1001216sp1]|uniref:1,4-alpha-glucan branching protein GlgB n=1 Tax=unclassified Romboutsia TaxID=2626894 RepID=UPI0018A10961|nr:MULTISPECIES: 1,4-alpha-glucan branching protein GlgB [unclassified Romboutsia]MDB8794731.1 1,4-alpha-glucan branching protein GlgB [Romboutsia sp. 1001216sp1]MDB8797580.1 1,4-alpha-glucan branching protein GlgB [Romboutsia sp. 1001216sp1]MDB8800440.1 1,4-alpha-glucan branching protein GlgB [Romboutsia sp. 1001216sp1]MDB8803297.1 1,4-alpha-glucan branching protein GlgB [Romboutsia sp. 1001216sp1]MDB8814696.1 1,4-alpha-glucan branching protein GlgB [Romboutsia sp. 1001216sp1]
MKYKEVTCNKSIIENIKKFKSGESYNSYKFLGCHIRDNITSFTLWAPNAKQVYLTGDFNNWNLYQYTMNNLNNLGFWHISLENIKEGCSYKYHIIGADGSKKLKSDPYSRFSEKRPNTASIVYKEDDYKWNDKNWNIQRKKQNTNEIPINIYEVHLGSWKRKWDGEFFDYKELYELVDYVKDMGYTHIEILPITEHPLDESWGYQTTGYYSSTSRYGPPEEFKKFIDRCHQNQIGVILDFAYSHFCKDDHGLYKFDGSAQYEYEEPLKAENIGWGTAHFDLGKPEVKSFLISNALYWFKEFHIDGIRVDAVSSMLYLDYDIGQWKPNKYGGRENLEAIEFIKEFTKIIYENVDNPLIIAEESTAWPMVTGPTYKGSLGFTYKWNMGWMNDTLKYMEMDPIYRKYHHELITFSFMYAFSENFILPLSHDEVVHGKKSLLDKMPGDEWKKFAGLRTLYAYYMIHPGKKLLFMGNEFAQDIEWRYAYGLEWELLERDQHKKIKEYVKKLNHLYKNEKALYEIDNSHKGFDFIDPHNNEQSIVVLMRKGKKVEDFIIAVINFTPIVHYDYKVGVPYEGTYEEVFNSDDVIYGGSGQTMKGSELFSINSKWHNKEHHIKIKVPPLGATFIKGKNLKKIKYEMDKGKKILIGGLSQDIKRINNSKILVKKKKL